ncbi:biotin--[acetyl-CoA-carboxylase] ligase [bacterium]|nr:biotin--[acetyl-CoA-carboxylase] ligase [bacterium]
MKVIKLETVDSTNIYAKSHIENLCDRTIVHALRQSKGRGRFNRVWVDLGENNLFFSIILKPSKEFSSVCPNITQYASLSLCHVLEKYGVSPKIKWPNDVMIDGERKISGVLSETVMQGRELQGLVVGIGVNLNANKSDVENIPDRIVTALNLEIGKPVNMEVFLNEFLDEFFKNYDEFLKSGFQFIKNEYIKKSCFLNKDLKVQVLSEIKSGFAKGINDYGELLLQTENNKELVLNIGDIL